MEYKALALEVGKSVSTLKRWKRKIEEISDYTFNENTVRIGRKQNIQVPHFTSSEVKKFKQMAQLIDKLGQDQAIRHVWGDKIPSQEGLYRQIKNIAYGFAKFRENVKKQWECLEKENKVLRQDIKNLEQEILVLKTTLQQKKRRFFK